MLSRSVNITTRPGDLVRAPKAAAEEIHGGAIVCLDAVGRVVPGSADPALAFFGIAALGAAPGEAHVTVRRNMDFLLRSAAGADAVGVGRIGRPCWIVDDELVAATDGGGTRPVAGIVTGVEGDGRVWVRGESASGTGQAGAAAGMRRIYAATNTDRDAAPIPDIDGEIILPFAPDYMQVRTGWKLYSGSTLRTSGTSEAVFVEGDTHVQTIFGSINWHEFDNIDALSDSVTSVSVGLLAEDYQLGELFTLEYEPSTRRLSLVAGEDPASTWRPVIHTLLIAGQ